MAHGNGHGAAHGGHGHGNGVGHETREANVKLIFYSAVGLAVTTAIICGIVVGLFNYFKSTQPGAATMSPFANPSALPPEPRLQVDTTVQIRNLRDREDRVLNTYAWVDQKAGIVRVPIERAIDIMAQRGLPWRDYGATATTSPSKPAPAQAKSPPKPVAQLNSGVNSSAR